MLWGALPALIAVASTSLNLGPTPKISLAFLILAMASSASFLIPPISPPLICPARYKSSYSVTQDLRESMSSLQMCFPVQLLYLNW